jgi:hypothetical protein
MMAKSIPLRFAGDGRIARLRELRGRDEYAVRGMSTANAIALLASLLEPDPATGTDKLQAADLVAADRDRLLAAVYQSAFGDRIESTLTCEGCGEPFDLHFSLDELVGAVAETKTDGGLKVLGNGRFEAPNGVTFRLPTGSDELAGSGMSAAELECLLLSRCTLEGTWTDGYVSFEELLEQVAPLIDLELVARCPECIYAQTVQFDIQSYLLGSIVAERRRLLSEINRIAKAYSWSLEEILSLSRSDRLHFVQLIENESVTK